MPLAVRYVILILESKRAAEENNILIPNYRVYKVVNSKYINCYSPRQVIELQGEIKRVQCVADIASHQSQSLLVRRNQHEKEIEEIRHMLYEYEKQTDDKLTIGM